MPKQQTKKYPSPLTLRLSLKERAQLERDAAGLSLSEYTRQRLFDNTRPLRITRNKFPVKDHEALAQLLGELGRTRIANNINQLAKAANSGSLIITAEALTALLEACADIRNMHDMLMNALGFGQE